MVKKYEILRLASKYALSDVREDGLLLGMPHGHLYRNTVVVF